MNKINNRVIVIGGNHHNLLGVVRALGKNGVRSTAIITNDTKYAYVKKSKFIENYVIIPEDEGRIFTEILKYKGEKIKPIIIPTSDHAAAAIDRNLDKLKKDFILPSVDRKQGKLLEYMNKQLQYELAKKNRVKMPASEVMELKQGTQKVHLSFPIILKPLESIDGLKSDIRVCQKAQELDALISFYKEKGYKKILAQEYIEDKQELCIIGYSVPGMVYVPGVIEKIRIFPVNRGSVSYGKAKSIKGYENILKDINRILLNINYEGLFDIEVFKRKDGSYVLNEMNFRNSGNAFIYTLRNKDLVYMFLKNLINDEISANSADIEEFYFIDDFLERKQFFAQNIKFKDWWRAKRMAGISLLKCSYDRRPLIWKKIYAILRRIDRRKLK